MSIVNFVYSDINPNYGEDINPEIIRNLDDINASIQTILSTVPGERWFYPSFGSNVKAYLFEPVDTITAGNIYFETIGALRKWEPRITVLNTSSVVALADNSGYSVTINYQLVDYHNIQGVFSALLISQVQ
jgi:phage baseplate assembly protein W